MFWKQHVCGQRVRPSHACRMEGRCLTPTTVPGCSRSPHTPQAPKNVPFHLEPGPPLDCDLTSPLPFHGSASCLCQTLPHYSRTIFWIKLRRWGEATHWSGQHFMLLNVSRRPPPRRYPRGASDAAHLLPFPPAHLISAHIHSKVKVLRLNENFR